MGSNDAKGCARHRQPLALALALALDLPGISPCDFDGQYRQVSARATSAFTAGAWQGIAFTCIGAGLPLALDPGGAMVVFATAGGWLGASNIGLGLGLRTDPPKEVLNKFSASRCRWRRTSTTTASTCVLPNG